MTKNMDADCRRAAKIPARGGLAGPGSNDAHREEELGLCYTDFDLTIRDARDLVKAICCRRGLPRKHGPEGLCSY